MSTLLQIESAVAELPADEQWTLLGWLQERLVRKSVPMGLDVVPERQRWLEDLEKLCERTHTGTQGAPLQQVMDDIRDEHF